MNGEDEGGEEGDREDGDVEDEDGDAAAVALLQPYI